MRNKHKLLQACTWNNWVTCFWNSPQCNAWVTIVSCPSLVMMLMDIFFCRSWYCDICFLGVLIWQFFLSSLLPCFTFLPVLLLSCWIAKQTWGTVFCKGRKITKPTFLASKVYRFFWKQLLQGVSQKQWLGVGCYLFFIFKVSVPFHYQICTKIIMQLLFIFKVRV